MLLDPHRQVMPKHARFTNPEQGNIYGQDYRHAWTDKMTERVISGAGRPFGWKLKKRNLKICKASAKRDLLVLSKSIL